MLLEANPELLLSYPSPLFIDEWRNVSKVWDVVRHPADRDPSGGQIPFGAKCDAPGWCNRSLRRRPNRQASHAPHDS